MLLGRRFIKPSSLGASPLCRIDEREREKEREEREGREEREERGREGKANCGVGSPCHHCLGYIIMT